MRALRSWLGLLGTLALCGLPVTASAQGQSYSVLHSFAGSEGTYPFAGLVQGSDGNFYGTTDNGGVNDVGAVFKIDSTGTTFETLHSFATSDGREPFAGLVEGTDGDFYGMTYGGGANGLGTVFKIDPTGSTFQTLYSFAGSDGANPLYATLVEGIDGNFYGTTIGGGANGLGTVFAIDSTGTTFATLHSFAGSDGANPYAGLVQGSDGSFYGTTYVGGLDSSGTVFTIDSTGTTFVTLHSFYRSEGTANPLAALVQGCNGKFFGTTELGCCGGNSYGTVFRIDSTGTTFTTLHSFAYASDGADPFGGVVQGTDRALYGTTPFLGPAGHGTVFRLASTDTTPPTVALESPNGGEKVFTGIGYVIRWTASDDVAIDHIDVETSVNGGGVWTPVPGCTGLGPTATTCTWATPGPTTSGFRARVTASDTSCNVASDVSNGNATIVAGTPFVTVAAPNTAVSLRVGNTHAVKFNHNLGKTQPVLVELNRSYPAGPWETITGSSGCTSTSNATYSACNWLVTLPITNNARVRATWVSSTATPVQDASDFDFRILSRITVTAPNTNVAWASGSTRVIKWTHNLGLASSFDIAIDTNGDLVCETPITTGVAAATATTGTYNWLVSGTGTTNRICVTNSANAADTDISDTAFKITP